MNRKDYGFSMVKEIEKTDVKVLQIEKVKLIM